MGLNDDGAPVDRRAAYEAMTSDQLIARLKVAEDALLLVGWSSTNLGGTPDSPRSVAAEQAWSVWRSHLPAGWGDATAHPDVDVLVPGFVEARARRIAETRRLIAETRRLTEHE